MTINSILKIQNLSIGFDRLLINNLNLEMTTGDRLIIYGSNGTGKSTFLRSLVKPWAEQKNNIQWNLAPDQVLYLNQQPGFHSQTPDTVKNYLVNILFLNKPFSRPKEEDYKKISEVQLKLNIPDLPLKNLSGGQRQKLKLARALLMDTKSLLLDEPFNAVDQVSTHEMINWLNSIRHEMIQLIVLHDFDQIEKLQSKILWIQENSWEILEFSDWFQKVDRHFHTWLLNAKKPHSLIPSGSIK